MIEDRYIQKEGEKKHFSVSMQHYVFAVHAFVKTVKKCDAGKYIYSVHETRTAEVLTNVRDIKSEIGVISYSKSNEKIMRKLFREYQLGFHPLMVRETFAYVWKGHPLSEKKEIFLEELKDYPCVSFDQSSDNDFYLTEEALGDYEFISIKLKEEDPLTIGYIIRNNHKLSEFGETYIEELKKYQD